MGFGGVYICVGPDMVLDLEERGDLSLLKQEPILARIFQG